MIRSRQTIILFLLAGSFLNAPGQTPYDPGFLPAAFLIREQLEVYTDRNLYCTGEEIQFRVDYTGEGVPSGSLWSKAVYMELITPDGGAVLQKKYAIDPFVFSGSGTGSAAGSAAGLAAGSMAIPSGIPSGSYLLKCYTRWMRNRDPRSFSYLPLKIFNPFSQEVIGPPEGEAQPQVQKTEYVTGYIRCEPDKEKYLPGETVNATLEISLPEHVENISFCVTVAPQGALELESGQFITGGSGEGTGSFRVEYLPDLQGVSFSGSIVSKEQPMHPVPGSRVYFAVLGEDPELFSLVTDQQGRFAVALPERRGVQELFVAQDLVLSRETEVRVDQDFDGEPVPAFPGTFRLDSLERVVGRHISLNHQLRQAFENGAISENEEVSGRAGNRDSTATVPFYGTPGFSIRMDDYVKLPTLEEVLVNLVPGTEVITRRNRGSIRVLSANNAISLYPPLILIDYIPVFDHQAILQIDPGRILKIDLLDEVYIKGNFMHGGILSIFSRQGDMAGIDLPAGSYFFDFHAIESDNRKQEPDYGTRDRVPDLRNTIYWDPFVKVTESGTSQVSFRAPGTPGTYVILVRGTAHPGSVLSGTASFTVEK